RGETQALVVATLGTGEDEQYVDALTGTYKETFLLHYNFPPFSVGETSRIGAPGLAAAPRLPLHAARGLRDHRVERLVLDGDCVRHLSRPDGRRRAAQGAD